MVVDYLGARLAGAGEPVALRPQRRLRAVGRRRCGGRCSVRCALTVFSLMPSRAAICLFGSPSATRAPGPRARAADSSGGRAALGARAGSTRAARPSGASGDSPSRGGADAAQQLVGLGVLEQVADGAGVERVEDALAVGEGRQDDDCVSGRAARCAAVASMPSMSGIERSISTTSGCVLARRASTASLAVGGRADDLDVVGRADEPAQPGADHGVVVGDAGRGSCGGTSSAHAWCRRPAPIDDLEAGRRPPRREVLQHAAGRGGRRRARRRGAASNPRPSSRDLERRSVRRRCGPRRAHSSARRACEDVAQRLLRDAEEQLLVAAASAGPSARPAYVGTPARGVAVRAGRERRGEARRGAGSAGRCRRAACAARGRSRGCSLRRRAARRRPRRLARRPAARAAAARL